ncbi:hypothetical protein IRB23SM22_10530 [Alkalibacterium sp. s-m-22]
MDEVKEAEASFPIESEAYRRLECAINGYMDCSFRKKVVECVINNYMVYSRNENRCDWFINRYMNHSSLKNET